MANMADREEQASALKRARVASGDGDGVVAERSGGSGGGSRRSKARGKRKRVEGGDEEGDGRAGAEELASGPPGSGKACGTEERDKAATKIQTAFRGRRARQEAKREILLEAWQALDLADESDLVRTHARYERLKESFRGFRVQTEAKEHLPVVEGHRPVNIADDKAPRLPETITLDFVTAMMDHFKHDGLLKYDDVVKILVSVTSIFKSLPNVVELDLHSRITVVGDIHGQLEDLLTIFKLNGLPSLRNWYLFNGDIVDRGQWSLECVLVLFCFKLLFPDTFHINRGNHEDKGINSRDGFEHECLVKYDSNVFELFSKAFAAMPVAHVLEKKVFVVHGGLFWDDVTLEEIQRQNRFHEIVEEESLIEQMLWSDPQRKLGRVDNPRGASLLFGPDVCQAFLRKNNLGLIIRSHECKRNGYEKMFDGQLITVFSASNYCGIVGNKGAFIVFEKNLSYNIVQFEATPKGELSRYHMRHAAIEDDVVSKLIRRISINRLGLLNHFKKLDRGDGTITRLEWSEGLKTVLGVNVPFLEFQTYLGLPKLGVEGRVDGRIDYMNFLDRYRIQLGSSSPPSSPTEDLDEEKEADAAMESLVLLLYNNKYELESLFRFFDANGDGSISLAELRDGIQSLELLLKEQGILTHHRLISERGLSRLLANIDTDHDGSIQFEEFFDAFRLLDPDLAEAERKGIAYHRAGRRSLQPVLQDVTGKSR